MSYTLYMHICPNGKRYIGITRQFPINDRWRKGKGYKNNTYFYRAIKKYGWENIEHHIISSFLSREEAEQKEQLLIDSYKTTDPKYGYNLTSGGELGKIYSQQTRLKIGRAHLGKKKSNEYASSLRKAVVQYSLEGIKINEYKSLAEASSLNNFKANTSISSCCKGKANTAYGYMWRFKEEVVEEKIPPYNGTKMTEEQKNRLANMFRKKVNQYSINGEYIETYISIQEACRQIKGKSSTPISHACKKIKETAYGYRWEYAEEQT